LPVAAIVRRVLLNIRIHNTDDHVRNHRYFIDEKGIRSSPGYDIDPSVDRNELSLAIERRKLHVISLWQGTPTRTTEFPAQAPGDQPLCARLRPANQDAAAGSVEEVKRIVRRVLLQLSSAYPWKDLYTHAFHALRCWITLNHRKLYFRLRRTQRQAEPCVKYAHKHANHTRLGQICPCGAGPAERNDINGLNNNRGHTEVSTREKSRLNPLDPWRAPVRPRATSAARAATALANRSTLDCASRAW
jgi:hypothetical protein